LINQDRTTQTNQQDDGTDEIKPCPLIENFPVHIVPRFSVYLSKGQFPRLL
jgi:hypothetical protein